MKLAFLKTGNEKGVNRHILSLLDYFRSKGVEVREFELDHEDVQRTINDILEFSPTFSMDINSTGMIVGQQEQNKVPMCDAFGFVHVSIFTDDPLLYFPILLEIRHANNFLPVVCDLKYADSLKLLGINKGLFYITPFLDQKSMKHPSGDKDIQTVFVGPVVDPQIIARQVVDTLPQYAVPLFFEVGEFMFRNPEVPVFVASEYILSMFQQSFQEQIDEWRREKPEEYLRFLNDVSIYATFRKRWYILSFLEGINLKILGDFQGELMEGHELIDADSHEDFLEVFDRSYMAVLSFPFNMPSGIGFTPLEVGFMGCAPVIDYRMTLPGFLTPGSECITYLPLDRADIEEKLLYYLEHLDEALSIGQSLRDKVLEKFSPEDRGEFLLGVFEQILNQASKNT
ncbi:glycosyltransferase [Hydrogenobacter hydrogenophilus]|uniref:Glycosyl transferases group 1 n=1 Tax=Hydrogenobacter hydrogenophilus TaxID=35835 RepID=A0A285P556_9AQUI|nr:glycosyltransferase [Hydrogenobacter hydrogenophilus]SNZ16407.1 Glycosyl transferases group 1 [Hydrogenobacter hydrogenophilus]